MLFVLADLSVERVTVNSKRRKRKWLVVILRFIDRYRGSFLEPHIVDSNSEIHTIQTQP